MIDHAPDAPDALDQRNSLAPWTVASLDPIDRHFAQLMERLASRRDPALALAAALLSHSRGLGHICLDLRRLSNADFVTELLGEPLPAAPPELRTWMAELRRSSVVGQAGAFKPMLLDAKGRLYLQRFWAAENELAQSLLDRARRPAAGVNEDCLRDGLRRLFPGAGSTATDSDSQARAAATSVRRTLTVICGGPGTGKTRTAAHLLALLLEQAGAGRLRMALAAPTGKAAARLQESIQQLKPQLACADEVKARLPVEAFTMHRLLGMRPESTRTQYHPQNPLPYDVVIVDEASMVDLPMMAKLLSAVSPDARLILLGDPDQLASVEPGAVLGDLCPKANPAGPLSACIVRLEKNYRFGPNDGMLALGRAVNAGDADAALRLLQGGDASGVSWTPLPPGSRLRAALRPWVLDYFETAVRLRDPLGALRALAKARVLVALHHGPYGLRRINQLAEEILAEAGCITPAQRWYAGRPILITRNDYQLGLYNGDVGILLPDASGGEPRAWFEAGNGDLRSHSPVRLPEHETVFAMTVHKSQGSEFDKVLLLLPDRPSPVLSRELIYTGITRARHRLDVCCTEAVLRGAIARRVDRASGLREALWGEGAAETLIATPAGPPPQ